MPHAGHSPGDAALHMSRRKNRHNPVAVARPVDLLNDPLDFKVCLLGSLGQTTFSIMLRTGLTFSQVNYRLGKAGIKRADFRRGESDIVKNLIRRHTDWIEAPLRKALRNHLVA
jgi:hypothetical protein